MASPQINLGDLSKNLSPIQNVYSASKQESEPGLWTTNPINQFLSTVSNNISSHRRSIVWLIDVLNYCWMMLPKIG